MTPDILVAALIGGAMIGAATAGLLLVNGRVAGISGILDQATRRGSHLWQWSFLAGLLIAGLGARVLGVPLGARFLEQGSVQLIAAGFLVGLGTRIGSGCTSGHGVCGIANLSIRSLVATLTFMLAAGVVVFLSHHW